ncbi:hypothetical protein ACFSSF_09130 [Dietzia aerolata]|uniref:hypothetical protein n=1 Tax=Dietzia aerolata TaxID=595984 RepID=UPI003640741D
MTAMDVEAPILCAQTTVIDARTVGESFIRLVVAGPELARWSAELVDAGTVRDAYVKLIIPPPGGEESYRIPRRSAIGWHCPSRSVGGCAPTPCGAPTPLCSTAHRFRP